MDLGFTSFSGGTALTCASPWGGVITVATCESRVRTTLPASIAQYLKTPTSSSVPSPTAIAPSAPRPSLILWPMAVLIEFRR